jgi:methylase of polypeptide subunit release factors
VEVQRDSLVGISDAPDLAGLGEWVDDIEEIGDRAFLLPYRRLQRIISDMRRAAEGLEISALGARIAILPHVYVPSDQSVVDLFAQNAAADVKDAEVLDMGTGTGVLALVAAKLGARRVVAADLNPGAVENVRDAGDLFAPVAGETFDVILFNPPWIEGRPKTLYDTAIYDEEHALLRRFVRELPGFLRPNGVCFIILSNATDLAQGGDLATLLSEAAAEAGLELRERARMWRVGRLLGARERVALLEVRRAV